MSVINKILYFLFPFVISAVIFYFLIDTYVFEEFSHQEYYIFLPIVIFIINIILGFYFNTDKHVYISIFLCITYYYCSGMVTKNMSIDPVFVFTGNKQIFLYLILLNFTGFSFTAKKGFFTLSGGVKILTILAQFIFLSFIYYKYKPELNRFISDNLFKLTVPLINVKYFVLVMIVLFILVNYVIKPEKGSRRYLLFWAMIFSCMPFISRLNDFFSEGLTIEIPLFFGVAGIVLLINIFIISWTKAFKDELTRVFNRQSLNEDMYKLHRNFSIAMVDIDYFKKVNDRHGHKSGDMVLQNIARVLNTASSGKVYRFGGEEFTIIYNHKKIDKLSDELEKIRKKISTASIRIKSRKERRIKVTVSIGLSFYKENSYRPTMVLKAADKLLYKAKKSGRNCVKIDKPD